MNRILFGLLLWLMLIAAQAAGPLWTFIPAPGSNPTQTVSGNGTAIVQYLVQNQSGKPKRLVIQPSPGITQTTPCQVAPNGHAGSSCILNLSITGRRLPKDGVHGGPALCQANADGSPNPNQCYQPEFANSLNITRSPLPGATISVNPTTLLFTQNSTHHVTVTNSVGSPVAAVNVTAIIPFPSNINLQSTTCGVSLAVGAHCTITFVSSAQEELAIIPISGDNTNTVNVHMTVTNQPHISITNPILQSRIVTVSGAPLSLEITNNISSTENANAITVSNKAACPNLSVDDTNCASVAPGASCTLELTSNTPHMPCPIVISGSNTANKPETWIAFSYLGGLVFEEHSGSGKVVIDEAGGFDSQWTSSASDIATDFVDGVNNTDNIVSNAACIDDTPNCAAQRCRDIDPAWYLPARDELFAVHSALCFNSTVPCNFGGFSFFTWSSSQNGINPNSAVVLHFPTATEYFAAKDQTVPLFHVRCVRAFTP
ncbi:hypothetical protein TUM19329_08240 [Legionella antarctica]|uniref:NHL repeat protein n=1 Tax=Legionella antarctica TaxID=2708020 RepID=A0A6F8T2K9_9GAMM|nr:DUF1566 domain-containing protein [Legionella antarctica]BCA94463.1 hypothetical protein TUM19329_08240 [Legionella antarctica]